MCFSQCQEGMTRWEIWRTMHFVWWAWGARIYQIFFSHQIVAQSGPANIREAWLLKLWPSQKFTGAVCAHCSSEHIHWQPDLSALAVHQQILERMAWGKARKMINLNSPLSHTVTASTGSKDGKSSGIQLSTHFEIEIELQRVLRSSKETIETRDLAWPVHHEYAQQTWHILYDALCLSPPAAYQCGTKLKHRQAARDLGVRTLQVSGLMVDSW